MFWSSRIAFHTAAHNLVKACAYQDFIVLPTLDDIFVATMRVRCLLRSRKDFVGWVALDEGVPNDNRERELRLDLATVTVSDSRYANYIRLCSGHEHTYATEGKHPPVVS